jgi:hypothetical protein
MFYKWFDIKHRIEYFFAYIVANVENPSGLHFGAAREVTTMIPLKRIIYI